MFKLNGFIQFTLKIRGRVGVKKKVHRKNEEKEKKNENKVFIS